MVDEGFVSIDQYLVQDSLDPPELEEEFCLPTKSAEDVEEHPR